LLKPVYRRFVQWLSRRRLLAGVGSADCSSWIAVDVVLDGPLGERHPRLTAMLFVTECPDNGAAVGGLAADVVN
jgi:hypothetical protein